MPHFIREKKIDCGENYKEVDIFPQFESEEAHKRRKTNYQKSIENSKKLEKFYTKGSG